MLATELTGQTTMGELLRLYPGASLALFQGYRVGSQDRYGFGPEEALESVLRRHLVFDVAQVLEFLDQCRQQEQTLACEPADWVPDPGEAVLDVRSADEFALGSLPGARLLGSEAVEQLRPGQALLLVCAQGLQAPAAARYFQARGYAVRFLRGGLEAYALEGDRSFPVLAGLAMPVGQWTVLPAPHMARFVFARVEPRPPLWLSGRPVLPSLAQRLFDHPEVESVVVHDNSLTVVCASPGDWVVRCQALSGLLEADLPLYAGEEKPRSEAVLGALLEMALKEDVSPALKGHKGTVELAGYMGGWAELRLGGGCQGCSSAALTVHREIAAVLMRLVPELKGLRDATDHALGRTPYQGPEPPPELRR
ncbi:MAG: NifU family protein [Candidatus Eremiobacteraeota bacterium]|nr:NifU family protein [Candidatus Eremiobacteraeota bacterium]